MKTLKKRIMTGIVAGAMAMSLAVPALADDGDPNMPVVDPETGNNKIDITAVYKETTIDVLVPTTANAVINPYGLGISVAEADGTKHTMMGQVASLPLPIMNKSSLDLSIGASVVGVASGKTTTSTMKLSSDSVKDSSTKSVFAKLQVVGTELVPGKDDAEEEMIVKVIDEGAKKDAWADAEEPVEGAEEGTGGKGEIIVGLKAASKEDMATLTAATMKDGTFDKYASGSIAMFRLTGDCSTNPKTAWEDEDTLKVTVTFTFSPVEAAEEPAPGV